MALLYPGSKLGPWAGRLCFRNAETGDSSFNLGVRIRGTVGDIDPLNQVPFKGAISRVKTGSPLRGPPNTT